MICTLTIYSVLPLLSFHASIPSNVIKKFFNQFSFLPIHKDETKNIRIYKRGSCFMNIHFYDTVKNLVHSFINTYKAFNHFYFSKTRFIHNLMLPGLPTFQFRPANFVPFCTHLQISQSTYLKTYSPNSKSTLSMYYSLSACLIYEKFLVFFVVIISFFKKIFLETKFSLKNTFGKKNNENKCVPFLFISFFAFAIQKYIPENETLLIYSESNFTGDNNDTIVSVIIDGSFRIPNSQFSKWPKLQYVYIGNFVTSIGISAFSDCSNLETVLIGENVKEIGNYAFANCIKLANVTIPSSVTSIGNSAFANCIKLANVTIPSAVTSIGNSAFYNCTNLYNVIIGENVKEIGNSAFANCIKLANVTIPSSVTSIGASAFYKCFNLYNVIIGENVKEIRDSAFSNCIKLANVTIPSSVTSIGASAFYNCFNLYNVIIGENVKEIGGYAFECCVMLNCIYFYGTQEPNVENGAFINVTATQVMVLSEYKDKCFGTLAVCIDTTVAGCAPMPTLPFAQSNTFSSSNTFAASLRGDISQTFSFTLTVTLSVSYSLTYSALGTQTLSYYLSNSMITYVETNFIYYSYTVIVYSTYYSYYSNFFTYVYLSPSDASGGMTTAALIGIICGAVAFVLIVVAAVTFLVKSNNRKEKSSVKLQFKETTTSTTKQYDDVDSIVEELAKEDEDNWI